MGLVRCKPVSVDIGEIRILKKKTNKVSLLQKIMVLQVLKFKLWYIVCFVVCYMNFLNKIIRILQIAVFLFCINLSVVHGGQISSVEFKLMELVNQQRANDLILNNVLCRVAKDHAIKLFVDKYDAAQEIETDNYLGIEEAGYRASASNEMTAMVVFSNYLSSGDAAQILFDFLEEQSIVMEEGDTLFSSRFSEMGICIYETSVSFSRARYNVYLAVINYAQPLYGATENHIMEARLKHLINQARTNPLEVVEWHGVLLDGASGVGVAGLLPPLNSAAIPEPEKILTYSYASKDIDSNVILGKIFSDLLLDDLVLKNDSDSVLLDPTYNGVDIQITRRMVEVEEGGYAIDCVARVGFGRIESQDNVINGLFYSDNNVNNLYDAGEELSHTAMVVYDAGIHSRTGIAGGIMEQVGTGHKGYQVVLFPAGYEMVVQDVGINELDNRFVMIQVENKSLE